MHAKKDHFFDRMYSIVYLLDFASYSKISVRYIAFIIRIGHKGK